jgi:hypothetical protein
MRRPSTVLAEATLFLNLSREITAPLRDHFGLRVEGGGLV